MPAPLLRAQKRMSHINPPPPPPPPLAPELSPPARRLPFGKEREEKRKRRMIRLDMGRLIELRT